MAQDKKNKRPVKRLSKRMIIILTTVLALGSITAFAAYVDVNQKASRENAQRVAMANHPILTWKKWTGNKQDSKEAAEALSSIASSDYKKSAAGKADQILSKAHSGVTQSQGEKIDNNTAKRMASYQKKHPNATESEMSKKGSVYTRQEAKKELGSSKGASYADKVSAANQSLSSGDDDDGSGEAQGLWGKIGKALLHIFWSSAIGHWAANNGVGATVFNYDADESPDGTVDDKAVIDNLDKVISKDPYQLMYPGSAYSSNMSSAMDYFGHQAYGVGLILLVFALIVGVIRMGWGQALDSSRSRVEWYHNLTDVFIAVAGILAVPALYSTILAINGDVLLGLEKYMAAFKTGDADGTLLTTAIHLGVSSDTISMISTGSFIGANFSGIVFNIIYLVTMIGLAVYIKYYYFVRMVAFTILASLGPVFIAFWPFNWGKARTFAWLKDLIGTVFIQSIHAFTLTFMAVLMQINNEQFQQVKNTTNPAKTFLLNLFGVNTGSSAVSDAVKLQSAHWETMVIGFIILILFQPVSRSLAELFGISTNMLENIHRSTSRTLVTGAAMAGGFALGGMALTGSALGTVGNGLAKIPGAKNAMDKIGNSKVGKALNSSAGKEFNKLGTMARTGRLLSSDPKKRHQAQAWAAGLVGRSGGQMIGLAAGAGGESMAVMLAGSKVGGQVGDGAARLAVRGGSAVDKKLAEMGLNRADPLRKQRAAMSKAKASSDQAINDSIKQRVDVNPGNIPPDKMANDAAPAVRTAAQKNFDSVQNAFNKSKENPYYKDKELMNAYRQQQAKKLMNGNFVNNSAVQKAASDKAVAFKNQAIEQWKANNPFEQWKAQQQAANQGDPEYNLESKAEQWKNAHPFEQWKADSGNPNVTQAEWSNEAVRQGKLALDKKLSLQWLNAANTQGDLAKESYVKAAQISAVQAGAASTDAFTPLSNIKTLDQFKADSASAWKNAHPKDNWLSSHPRKTEADWENQALKQGERAAKNYHDYATNAFANTDGTVLSHTDQSGNSEFTNSVINRNTFNRHFRDNLADAMMSTNSMDGNTIKNLVSDYHDDLTSGIDGESMMQTIGTGKDATQVVNSDLLNKVNAQYGYTTDNTLNLNDDGETNRKLNRESLDSLYNGTATNNVPNLQGLQQDYNNAVHQAANEYAEGYRNRLNSPAAMDSAVENGSQMLDLWSTLGGLGGRASAGRGSSFGAGGFGPSNPNDELTFDNPYDTQPESLSIEDARDMVPTITNDRGEVSTVPGALRMVVGNNNSYLEVQDKDGIYHALGQLGAGDGNLSATDQVFQNMDFSPSGDLIPMIDQATHQATSPYRVVNGEKIPAALPAGLPSVDSFFGSDHARDYNNSLAYRNLPKASHLTANTDGTQPTLDNYQGYTSFDLRGDSSGMVVTGVDPLNGQREVLTSSYLYDKIPLNDGVEFVQPLTVTNGELSIGKGKPEFSFNPFSYGENEKTNITDSLTNKIRQNSEDLVNFANDTMIKPTKPVASNNIANNPPHNNLGLLDTFSKQ